MDEKEIRKLLQSERRPRRRGWRCPDDNQLAAYISGRFDESKRKAFETHAANCDSCISAIGFLALSAEWPAFNEVPAHLLSRARNLISAKPPATWRWRWAMATAATASVVLIVAFIALRFRAEQMPAPPSGPLVAQQHQPDVPVVQATPTIQLPVPAPTRSVQKPKSTEVPAPSLRGGAEELKPIVVLPRDGAVLRRDQLQFRWKPMADAAFYEVNVVTEEGGLIFKDETSEAQLRLDDNAQLQPGAKYFVTVVAHMREGRTAKSNIVSFRLAGQ